MLAVDLWPFVCGWREFVDLGHLPHQTLTLILQCGLRGARFLQGLDGASPGGPCRAQGLQVHARVGVEQAAHSVGASQALPSVLAMNVEHAVAQGAKLGGSGGAAIDPRAAFALCVDGAFEQQAALLWRTGKAFIFQPRVQVGGGVKFRANFSPRCPFAHHTGIGACAHDELQCVNQDRFASTGFACQCGKALRQVQIELTHDHKITQDDVLQTHATPSFQWSFLRKVSK